jgi:hypothetical protein
MWNLEMQAVKRARAAITVHGVPLYRIELGDTLGARGDSPALAQICAHRVDLAPSKHFRANAPGIMSLTGFLPPEGSPVRVFRCVGWFPPRPTSSSVARVVPVPTG